jgi:RND family efflux transporter MFP subunit
MRSRLRWISALLLIAASGGARAEELADFASRASCLIEPNNIYKLAIAAQGALANVAVLRSDKVTKGQIIAELESGVEQAQVEAARARAATEVFIQLKTAIYEAAQSKVDRQLALRDKQISSQQSLEEAQSAAAVAKADLEQARLDRTLAGFEVRRLEAALERRILRSPADGVVTAVDLHTGEYADPTNSVATVTEIDPLKVDIYLPAHAYPLVKLGARGLVTAQDPPSGPREAVVVTKDPQIDASSGLFLVQLRLPNPDGAIPAGVRCKVEFPR